VAFCHDIEGMQAHEIITALGGFNVVASATGANRNSVVYWGLRGRIPTKRWPEIIGLARQCGRSDITAETLANVWNNPTQRAHQTQGAA
jgi:hypothetical protein